MINYKPLLKFMLARHEIYLRRKSGNPPPWSSDPIFLQYKFTNVYRQLDRVTVWINRNISDPYKDHPHLWFMLCMARQIGWPPTLEELMAPAHRSAHVWPRAQWSWMRTMEVMRERAARGEKNYTGAYMLNAHGERRPEIKGHGRFDKPLFTCRLVLQTAWDDRKRLEPIMHASLQSATEALMRYFGWGGFMAYEVACDLRYTRYLRDAPDKLTWAHAGPGARRGLSRLTGKLPTPAVATEQMRELLEQISPRWPHQPQLEMREIEHSTCEFDKMERVRNGEGTPKTLFKPQDEGRLP